MKKKDAIQKGIDNIPIYQGPTYEDKQREALEKRKDDARPALLKRIAAALLDFLFAAAFAAGLFTIAYFTIFPEVGYQKASQTMVAVYDESGLYLKQELGLGYDQLTSRYDDSKTPEQNYDVPLSKFYSTNARAVSEDKLQEYINRKIDSTYYYINENDQCVRKNTVTDSVAREFLEKEYNLAVDYLFSDPEVSNAVKVLTYSIPITILVVVIVSSAIFYFAVPLIDNKHRTFGYMICKVMPVNSDDLTKPNRGKIALRSLMFVIINYISIITIGLFLNGSTFAFIPFFINTVIICFSHSNSGLHDYGTKIIVVNESMSNAMSALKQIAGNGE